MIITPKKHEIAILFDHSVKIKKSKKIDKYLGRARELKKLWNMQIKVILVVIDVVRMVPRGPEKGVAELEISGKHSDYKIVVIG